MNCRDIRPLLSAYIDGEATPEEKARVERHLAGCADCHQALSEYRAIGGGIRAMPNQVPPASLRRDVWRAIEAQEAGRRWIPTSPRAQGFTALPRRQPQPGFASVFTNLSNGWAKALPAALLIGALALAIAVVMLRGPVTVAAAHIVEQGEIFNYSQPVHVKFNKDVNPVDAEKFTYVHRVDGASPFTVTVTSTFHKTGTTGELELKPSQPWQPGAKYEVLVDCPKIRLVVGDGLMQNEPLVLGFVAAAHTATPTSTPTNTATPTETSLPPTNTHEPTAIAHNTPAASPSMPATHATPPAVSTQVVPIATGSRPSATTQSNPTATRPALTATPPPVPISTSTVEPTRAVSPTNTSVPAVTQTVRPSQTVTPVPASATPSRKGTATATATSTPRVTPTSVIACSITPVRGFGKIWQSIEEVRERVGCPAAPEGAVAPTAYQRFEGGYMFWRGDTRTIYAFIGNPTDAYGVWKQFPDTWQEGDPEPQPAKTPPAKLFVPVRGFGKVWYNNEKLQLALGWAVERETNTGAVWQTFESGNALWTADHTIRFLYSDGIYARFEDSFVPPSDE